MLFEEGDVVFGVVVFVLCGVGGSAPASGDAEGVEGFGVVRGDLGGVWVGLAEVVGGGVAGDGQDPGADAALSAEAVGVLEDRKKGVLEHVFGGGQLAAAQGAGELQDGLLVAGDEAGEGGAVVGGDGLDISEVLLGVGAV